MKAVTFPDHLKYTFSAEEKDGLLKGLLKTRKDLEGLQDKLETFKSQHKADVTRVETDQAEYARKLEEGSELREVQCLVLKFRPDADSAMIVRLDSGRIVRIRKLELPERQQELTTEPPESISMEADFEYEESDHVQKGVSLYPCEVEKLIPIRKDIKLRPRRPLLSEHDPNAPAPNVEPMEGPRTTAVVAGDHTGPIIEVPPAAQPESKPKNKRRKKSARSF